MLASEVVVGLQQRLGLKNFSAFLLCDSLFRLNERLRIDCFREFVKILNWKVNVQQLSHDFRVYTYCNLQNIRFYQRHRAFIVN